jgi:hypothetical protein
VGAGDRQGRGRGVHVAGVGGALQRRILWQVAIMSFLPVVNLQRDDFWCDFLRVLFMLLWCDWSFLLLCPC